jgi:hypothetical protein
MMELIKMIPFLEEEELKELAQKISESPDGVFEGVCAADILPFLDDEDVGAMMIAASEKGERIAEFLPFVDEDSFTPLINAFAEGKPIKELEEALPFMEEEQVDALADVVIKNGGSYNGITLEQLMPFISDERQDKAFLEYARANDPQASAYAPYASDDALHELAEEYLNGKIPDLDVSPYYQYFDEDDLRLIFKAYMAQKKK